MTSNQICSRCVMDHSDLEIVFNANGECNHCTNFIEKRKNHSYQKEVSEQKLTNLIHEIKKAGKNKNFDCVVGLSGGVDSSYVAYLANSWGLRVLGVHMDNGWNAENAVENIYHICHRLSIDYRSYVLDWSYFKEIQLAFLKASVPEAETPTDMAIQGALHQIATKNGIKYILSGGNLATEGILPKSWHYNAKDMVYFKHILKRFGKKKFYKFPYFGFWQEFYYKMFKRIKIVYPLNHYPYNKEQAKETLIRELNWKDYGGKHHESRYTRFIQSFYLVNKFNIDYRKATLSSMICLGEISREEALKQLKTQPYSEESLNKDKQYVSKKLGISLEQLEDIVNSKANFYFDFPNDEKRLGKIYDLYRKLYKKEKLANF